MLVYRNGLKQEFSSCLYYLIKPKEEDPYHLNSKTSLPEQRLSTWLYNPNDIELLLFSNMARINGKHPKQRQHKLGKKKKKVKLLGKILSHPLVDDGEIRENFWLLSQLK